MTIRLTVRLTPRGGRDAIEGWARDAGDRPFLKVRVTAPPVDGSANAALERMIAETLRVGRGSVRMVAGGQARTKVLEIDGVAQSDLDRALGRPG